MRKVLSIGLGLIVAGLAIVSQPIQSASARQPTNQTYNYSPDYSPDYSPPFRFGETYIKEELRKIYDDSGSEYRKKRKNRLLDLIKVTINGRSITNAIREQAFREMITIRREFGDKRGEISGFIGIATTYAQRMRHREAMDNLKIAIELARSSGDIRIEYETLTATIKTIDISNGLVPINVCAYLIRRDSSFDWIEARLEYLEEKLNQLKLSGIAVPQHLDSYNYYTIEKIGDSYSSRKAYLKAIESYNKTIKRISGLLDREQILYRTSVYENMAEIYVKTALLYKLIGNHAQANDAINSALDYYSRLGLDREYKKLSTAKFTERRGPLLSKTMTNLATLAIAKKSEELIQRVIKFWRAGSDKIDDYLIFESIGDAYESVADYKMAIQYYEQTIKSYADPRLSREGGISNVGFNRLQYYRKLARAYTNMGDESTGLKYYLLAYDDYLMSYEQKRSRKTNSTRSQYMADLYRIIGKQLHDLSSYDDVELLVEIGNLYKRRGKTDKAINFYTKAQNILENSDAGNNFSGGSTATASILSDEDDLGKLLTDTSKERKPETTNQDSKK